MYIPPWHNTPIPGADTTVTPRGLLITGAVSTVFAITGGLAAVNGLRAAEQLEARPDIVEARYLQTYIPESPTNTIADAAYQTCWDKLDGSAACQEKAEIVITAKRLREFSAVAVLESSMALLIAGVAAGSRGGGGSGGGRREKKAGAPDEQPYVPPLTIV